MAHLLDSKPYVEYDPLIGYRYIPETRCRLPRPGGGDYEMAINSAGIRSCREYSKEKPAGVFRILILGDSYAAGQYVSNDHRFSELLERRQPHLEVINFALEGTGTDQQLLIYESVASQYEHDLVMVVPFLQNIRRNLVDARVAYEPTSGARILRGKPRFELVDGQLVLRNTPVPADSSAAAQTPPTHDDATGVRNRLKSDLSRLPTAQLWKKMIYGVLPWEPFPEYRRADTAAWVLMEAILDRFRRRVAPRPFVVMPVFYDSYVRFRMSRSYWQRFRSLERLGVHVIDLLGHFRRLGPSAVKCFQMPHDCHFSSYGHLVVADALLGELKQRNLLPTNELNDEELNRRMTNVE